MYIHLGPKNETLPIKRDPPSFQPFRTTYFIPGNICIQTICLHKKLFIAYFKMLRKNVLNEAFGILAEMKKPDAIIIDKNLHFNKSPMIIFINVFTNFDLFSLLWMYNILIAVLLNSSWPCVHGPH